MGECKIGLQLFVYTVDFGGNSYTYIFYICNWTAVKLIGREIRNSVAKKK